MEVLTSEDEAQLPYEKKTALTVKKVVLTCERLNFVQLIRLYYHLVRLLLFFQGEMNQLTHVAASSAWAPKIPLATEDEGEEDTSKILCLV